MHLFISPHPPIIIDNIGLGEQLKANKTIKGLEQIANDINTIKPRTIVIITPHGNVFRDALCINVEEKLTGDFSKFNHSEVTYTFKNDIDNAKLICKTLNKNKIPCLELDKTSAKKYNITTKVDHGALVPLHFIIKKYLNFKLIHISIGYLSKIELYKAGMMISDILKGDSTIIVSGDLSHKLTKEAPYGYNSMGKIYDKYIVETIKTNNYISILDIDENMVEQAGSCIQKPLELFIGVLEGYKLKSTVYSYEGPFGVGYMTAHIKRMYKTEQSVLEKYIKRKNSMYEHLIKQEDAYVKLARKTINEYINNKIKIKVPIDLPDELYNEKKGAFVTIKKEGQLRGCIGTILSTKKNVAEEIIENAILAATQDPRFNEIELNELKDLVISVDVLYSPEDITDKSQLDVKKYGVIVQSGYKRGLLLPNLEGVDSVEKQIDIALEKANIDKTKSYKLQRFKVERHE